VNYAKIEKKIYECLKATIEIKALEERETIAELSKRFEFLNFDTNKTFEWVIKISW
jgi:hypothetical protein